MSNQNGQSSVELTLLLVIFVTILGMFSTWAQKNQLLPNLISKPFTKVAGMIEGGEWEEPKKIWSKGYHPHDRTMAREPK